MISTLLVMVLLSFTKLLMEDSLLLILMIMEMISMLSYFSVLVVNPEVLSLTSCMVTLLTLMISEGVMSLAMFISLLRSSPEVKVSSFSLSC